MKKILLSAIIASSFAMSGDIAKCSHAIDMQFKYLEAGTVERKNKYELMQRMKHMTAEWREETKETVQDYEEMGMLFSTLGREWNKVAQKECRGIVHNDRFGFAEGKQK